MQLELQTSEAPPGSLDPVVRRPAERLDLYCEHAKDKAKLPDRWRCYKWECFPKRGDAIYVAVTGAVCEHWKPNGETDWKKRDKTTDQTINLPIAEHDAWKIEWERRTNQCHQCLGSGVVLASWSAADGEKTRTCPRCKGARTPNAEVSDGESASHSIH